MTKPASAFRLDPVLLEKTRKMGINLVELFEAALADAVSHGKCPFCKQEIKGNKHGKSSMPKLQD